VRASACRIDLLVEPHLALERPVLDLQLLVDVSLHLRSRPLAANEEGALADNDLEAR
jgi:hypothetical protein